MNNSVIKNIIDREMNGNLGYYIKNMITSPYLWLYLLITIGLICILFGIWGVNIDKSVVRNVPLNERGLGLNPL